MTAALCTAGVPSDHVGTRTKNVVMGSESPRAANTGVPLSRTTEMANSLVIVIKRIFLLLLVGASALQPIKPIAVRDDSCFVLPT